MLLEGFTSTKKKELIVNLLFHRIQTISGTGANHYGGAFLERFYEPWQGKKAEDKVIYISNPTWGAFFFWIPLLLLVSPNFLTAHYFFPFLSMMTHTANHKSIFSNVGLKTVDYPYYDPSTIGLALPKFLDFLKSAPEQSVFLLHACAHNPTGVDPTRDEWQEISKIFKQKKHFAFFDCAYQVCSFFSISFSLPFSLEFTELIG